MTKYLIAGDWHMNHVWAKKVIDKAVKYNIDKIIQVGDFGIWPGPEGEEYLNILSHYLVKRNINLYFLPGNHEDWNQIDSWVDRYPYNIDGHQEIRKNLFYTGKVNSWIWHDKVFAVVGGATSIDKKFRIPQKSWWPQEALNSEELLKAKKIGKVDYLFTHDTSNQHPFNWLMNDLSSEMHREYLTEVGKALRPFMWFHGHYHMYQEYGFSHKDGWTAVYSLDADDKACQNKSLAMQNNIVEFDSFTGIVTRIWGNDEKENIGRYSSW